MAVDCILGDTFLFFCMKVANSLEKEGNTDDGIDIIMSNFDIALSCGKFNAIDNVLAVIKPEDYPVVLLISLLTITNMARKELHGRADFLNRVRAHCDRIGKNEKGLLDGLH